MFLDVLNPTPPAPPAAKRKTTTAPPKQNKKAKVIDSDWSLDIEPEDNLPDYVPETLVVPKHSDEIGELPIYLKHHNNTVKIHCDYQVKEGEESFWVAVAKGVEELQGLGYKVCPPIEGDLHQLKLGESSQC